MADLAADDDQSGVEHHLPRLRGPQGVVAAERMIEEIAYALGRDPVDIRKGNFYGGPGRDPTPCHQMVEDIIIARVVEELEVSSDYRTRREAIIVETARTGSRAAGSR